MRSRLAASTPTSAPRSRPRSAASPPSSCTTRSWASRSGSSPRASARSPLLLAELLGLSARTRVTALRIATRRSDLAMAQAGIVRLLLTALGCDAVLLPVDTTATTARSRRRRPARTAGSTRSSRRSEAAQADLAVHSAKDLPADDPDDLVIAAVPERADPRDVLVAGRRRPSSTGRAAARRARRHLVAAADRPAPRGLPRRRHRRRCAATCPPALRKVTAEAWPTSRCWRRPGSTGSGCSPPTAGAARRRRAWCPRPDRERWRSSAAPTTGRCARRCSLLDHRRLGAPPWTPSAR